MKASSSQFITVVGIKDRVGAVARATYVVTSMNLGL